jgi:putative transposase
MTTDFYREADHEALTIYGIPNVINSAQGSQFANETFSSNFKDVGVAISIDDLGRAIDNVFIERLWRTFKHDHVYIEMVAIRNRTILIC